MPVTCVFLEKNTQIALRTRNLPIAKKRLFNYALCLFVQMLCLSAEQ